MAGGIWAFQRFLLLTALLMSLAACATTGAPKTAIEERAAQIAARTCLVGVLGDSGEKISSNKIDIKGVSITRLEKDAAGWVRIGAANEGFIGNIHYLRGIDVTICESQSWSRRFGTFTPVSSPVTLADLGGHALQAQAPASLSAAAKLPAPARPDSTMEGRLMKVIWSGSSNAVTGGILQILAAENNGGIVLTLPDGKGQCDGNYFYDRRTGKGTWGTNCSGDVSAWGDIDATRLSGGAVGRGWDNKGHTIFFFIDAAPN